jgi:hypothetical protein
MDVQRSLNNMRYEGGRHLMRSSSISEGCRLILLRGIEMPTRELYRKRGRFSDPYQPL